MRRCREGCEGSREPQHAVCRECWNRLPQRLQLAIGCARLRRSRESLAVAVQSALGWLERDDDLNRNLVRTVLPRRRERAGHALG